MKAQVTITVVGDSKSP